MTYHGWLNRQSWCLHLWLTNEQHLYDEARAMASGGSEQLKEWVESSLWPDLHLTEPGRVMKTEVGSLEEVDWQSITESLLEE